jgi:hypothetical protein
MKIVNNEVEGDRMEKDKKRIFPPLIDIEEADEKISEITRNKVEYHGDYICYKIEDFHEMQRELRYFFVRHEEKLSHFYLTHSRY